jgi:signal transduction histidine kinase
MRPFFLKLIRLLSHMKISTKIFAGFVLISFIFTSVVIINYQLSKKVVQNSSYLTNSQVIIRVSSALYRHIIDMETGLRGYLLTGNEVFLEPYYVAENQLPGMYTDLRKLVKNAPVQLEYLNQISDIQTRWQKTFSEKLITEKKAQKNSSLEGLAGLTSASEVINLKGKQMTDEIRNLFKGFTSMEYAKRKSNEKILTNSIARTQLISTFLTVISVLLGLGWAYYISRFISGRIFTMVKLADKIAQGNYKIKIHDHVHDELSHLSKSLNKMAGTIHANITELEAKNTELDQFAYVVSHDLKAPLRGIENASRWIEEDMSQDLPANIQEYLVMMRIRVHRMENLINGILALARIGREKEVQEIVDVQVLLSETIDMVAPPPHIKVEVAAEMPVLYTVRIHLQQVFSNLISNAVKYHDKAAGLIRIYCQEENNFYRFSVSDDGPGIDPAYHERIFVIFQTLQERDALESTGVGLAIVKKIIQRQGGTVQIDSKEGAGSTFSFTWPRGQHPRPLQNPTGLNF